MSLPVMVANRVAERFELILIGRLDLRPGRGESSVEISNNRDLHVSS